MTLAKCNKDSGRPVKHDWPADTAHHEGYVDLGLISMTLWKSNNEINPADTNNLFTYDEAVALFGNQLPTMMQFQELMRSCHWQWISVGFYRVTGPSGRYIILPAAGSRDCNGNYAYNRTYGFYWSSTPDGDTKAWYLNFYFNETPFRTMRFGRPTVALGYVEFDEAELQSIAETTGGRYYAVSDRNRLDDVMREIDALEKTRVESDVFVNRTERFFAPLAVGVALLAIASALNLFSLQRPI